MNLLPNRIEIGKLNSTDLSQESIREIAPTLLDRCAWIGFPALASLTMIAATDHVSHHVAPEPRLWITTLGLYLLTFIITFDHERWYRRGIVAAICLCAIAFLTGYSDMLDWLGLNWSLGAFEVRWSHFVVMFLICFLCHGELVRLQPKSNEYLTEFYMCVSAGGSFAWIFYFEDPWEWRSTDSSGYTSNRIETSRNFYGVVSVEDQIHQSELSKSYRGFYSGYVTHGMQLTSAEARLRPVSYYGSESGIADKQIRVL